VTELTCFKAYDVRGEVIVTDDFLDEYGFGKRPMPLVDEERQDYLIKALREQTTHVKKDFGANALYVGKVALNEGGGFFVKDLTAQHCELYCLMMP
jgi:hypothetical protein